MRAFVTGATGFIGSHLVDALLDAGDDVVCLARDPFKVARIFGSRAPSMVQGDLSDAGALRTGCAGADVVFHVAGLTAARTAAEFLTANHDHTRRLLKAAGDAAAGLRRFVYVSSLSAAGPSRRGSPLAEDDAPHPISAYGRSKLAGETAVRESGLPWTIVRPPAVYGPRDAEFLRVFRLARFGVMPQFGDPTQELSFVFVRDLVAALIAATAPECAARIYFASHPEITTARAATQAIFAAARQATGRVPAKPTFIPVPSPVTRAALWLFAAAARLQGRSTLLSPDKGSELLAEAWTCSAAALERDAGWRATTGLTTGLATTATWYRERGLL